MSEVPKLLLVDDDEVFCHTLTQALQRRGYDVSSTHNLRCTTQLKQDCLPQFAIIDLYLGKDSGLDIIQYLLKRKPDIKIVVLTGFASISTAVESIKLGAIHYLTKPVMVDEILNAFNGNNNINTKPQTQPMSIKRMEWEHIHRVLANNDGNISKAARAMKMHRRTLQRKLQKKPVKE